jgi:predicted amidophosphoribosyltransferase
MSDRAWGFCSACQDFYLCDGKRCPECGKKVQAGKVSREQKSADPRIQKPEPNREVKKR